MTFFRKCKIVGLRSLDSEVGCLNCDIDALMIIQNVSLFQSVLAIYIFDKSEFKQVVGCLGHIFFTQ